MCLGLPVKIIEITGNDAVCSRDGITVKCRTDLIPDARPGMWVMVHAGFAIERISESEADETVSLLHEISDVLAGEDQ